MPLPPRSIISLGAVFSLVGIDFWLRSFFTQNGSGVCNPGIAFSVPVSPSLLLTLSFLLTVFFFWLWQREKEAYRAWAFLLLLAGGGGNFLDRLLFSCVRDYIKLPFFPSFNLSDMMLTLGVGLLLWNLLSPDES